MTVKELIQALHNIPEDLELEYCSWDEQYNRSIIHIKHDNFLLKETRDWISNRWLDNQ